MQKRKGRGFRLSSLDRADQSRDLSEFQIIAKLGAGAFGTVYKVRDIATQQVFAMKQIKLIYGDSNEMNEKLAECSLIKDLRHPNICKFHEYFVSRQTLCILSEFCDRGDLAGYLQNQNGLPISDSKIKKFALEMLLAINYLHQ